MATTAAPYGLRPVNLIGGLPYAGSTRQIKIASGYATNIFNGSIVALVAAGTVEVPLTPVVGSAANPLPAGTIGVFVGCTYTDPNLKYKIFSQYWPEDTVASDAMAYVVDDPNVLFQAQGAGSYAQAALGTNVPLSAAQSNSTGSTTTGNSTSALGTAAVTSGIAFRIVDFVESTTSTVGDTYTDVLVKFNPLSHSYTNPTGI